MTQMTLTMASNGRVVIPARMRADLGLAGGERLAVRVLDGALVLEPVSTAIARAQQLVARYVPPGSGLVDELIAERHAAAALE